MPRALYTVPRANAHFSTAYPHQWQINTAAIAGHHTVPFSLTSQSSPYLHQIQRFALLSLACLSHDCLGVGNRGILGIMLRCVGAYYRGALHRL